MKRTLVLLALGVFAAAGVAGAANVDLVTLPSRQSVQLTIYNSEDITLVKEMRFLTLKKGGNKLQFSWANTLIDPTSVTLRPLEHKDEVELVDTVFPGQKPQHLIWNIESKFEGQVKMEVTYFTSGLTWSMDYVGIVDPDETRMHFLGFVRVFNNSGEEYENAQVRLIVGTVNLVEKIADLAKRRGIPVPMPAATAPPGGKDQEQFKALQREAAGAVMEKADKLAASDAKQIVKEGLSEYFM
jgi:hypothetical protein